MVLGIVGTFVLPPPVSLGEAPWRRLAQFVAAVLLALMFVAARRGASRGPLVWWWIALVGLALSVGSALSYDHLSRAWSCPYDGARVVVGDAYTPRAREARRQDPDVTCERLIADFAGRTDELWLPEGMRRRESVLAAAYVGAVTLFTICIVAVVEAIARVDKTRQPSGARRRSER